MSDQSELSIKDEGQQAKKSKTTREKNEFSETLITKIKRKTTRKSLNKKNKKSKIVKGKEKKQKAAIKQKKGDGGFASYKRHLMKLGVFSGNPSSKKKGKRTIRSSSFDKAENKLFGGIDIKYSTSKNFHAKKGADKNQSTLNPISDTSRSKLMKMEPRQKLTKLDWTYKKIKPAAFKKGGQKKRKNRGSHQTTTVTSKFASKSLFTNNGFKGKRAKNSSLQKKKTSNKFTRNKPLGQLSKPIGHISKPKMAGDVKVKKVVEASDSVGEKTMITSSRMPPHPPFKRSTLPADMKDIERSTTKTSNLFNLQKTLIGHFSPKKFLIERDKVIYRTHCLSPRQKIKQTESSLKSNSKNLEKMRGNEAIMTSALRYSDEYFGSNLRHNQSEDNPLDNSNMVRFSHRPLAHFSPGYSKAGNSISNNIVSNFQEDREDTEVEIVEYNRNESPIKGGSEADNNTINDSSKLSRKILMKRKYFKPKNRIILEKKFDHLKKRMSIDVNHTQQKTTNRDSRDNRDSTLIKQNTFIKHKVIENSGKASILEASLSESKQNKMKNLAESMGLSETNLGSRNPPATLRATVGSRKPKKKLSKASKKKFLSETKQRLSPESMKHKISMSPTSLKRSLLKKINFQPFLKIQKGEKF